jgi:hypothetical protein
MEGEYKVLSRRFGSMREITRGWAEENHRDLGEPVSGPRYETGAN